MHSPTSTDVASKTLFDFRPRTLNLTVAPFKDVVVELINLLYSGDEAEDAVVGNITNEFLFCYRRFSSASALYNIITNQFNIKSNPRGIFRLLRLWILLFFTKDFNYKSKHRKPRLFSLLSFLNKVNKSTINAANMMGIAIHSSQFDLNKLKLAILRKHRLATANIKLPGPSLLEKFTYSKDVVKDNKFFAFDSAAIAEQLTLLEYSIFKQVDHEEFYDLRVSTNSNSNKTTENRRAPNLTLLINRANFIAYWVATNILAQTNAQTRAKAITKFIIIAHWCEQLGNYNSLEAILSGFRLNQIDRLRKTWGVKVKYLALLITLEDIMKPANNYSNYRKLLSKRKDLLKDQVPSLPYIGIFLKDLTFIEDGNPDVFVDKRLNINKINMLGNTLRIIKAFQLISFDGVIKNKNVALLRYLAYLPHWSEIELERASEAVRSRKTVVDNESDIQISDSDNVSSIIAAGDTSDASDMVDVSVHDSDASKEDLLQKYLI